MRYKLLSQCSGIGLRSHGMMEGYRSLSGCGSFIHSFIHPPCACYSLTHLPKTEATLTFRFHACKTHYVKQGTI